MIKLILILASTATILLAAPSHSRESQPRMVTEAEAPNWRGVGRLNVAGRRFCTATLITETIAVTAAHCLFHPRSGAPIQFSEMRFVAGLRLGSYAASRRIVRVATPDAYRFGLKATPQTLRYDMALIELSAPIERSSAEAFPIGSPLGRSERLALVSYSKDRAHAPSIQRPCRATASMRRIAALNCRVNFGASGAPVFTERGGRMSISAVVSAMGRDANGSPRALAVMTEPLIDELKSKLAATPARHAPPRLKPVARR